MSILSRVDTYCDPGLDSEDHVAALNDIVVSLNKTKEFVQLVTQVKLTGVNCVCVCIEPR